MGDCPTRGCGEGPLQGSVQAVRNDGELLEPPPAGAGAAAGAASESVSPLRPDADGWLSAAAARHTSGDTGRMAQRLLDDFRRGVLGPIALELPRQS